MRHIEMAQVITSLRCRQEKEKVICYLLSVISEKGTFRPLCMSEGISWETFDTSIYNSDQGGVWDPITIQYISFVFPVPERNKKTRP